MDLRTAFSLVQVKDEEVEVKRNRYTVRPLRDFSSAFEKRQVEKEQARQEQEEKKREQEEATRVAVSVRLEH